MKIYGHTTREHRITTLIHKRKTERQIRTL